LKGVKRTAGWLDHQDVCLKLKISKRTLQTLRDNGTLAYTKIGKPYLLPAGRRGAYRHESGGQTQGCTLQGAHHLKELN
jgi:hypothetical protein